MNKKKGKAIACGYDDGSISLFDIEAGTELFSNKQHENSIKLVSWTSENANLPKSTRKITQQELFRKKRGELIPKVDFISKKDGPEGISSTSQSVPFSFTETSSLPILCSISDTKIVLSYSFPIYFYFFGKN